MEAVLIKAFLLSQFFIHALCGATCNDIKQVVDIHNNLRSQVAKGQLSGQPKASNMQKLAWNEELARHAQAHSEKHTIDPSNLEKVGNFTKIGENIYNDWISSQQPPTNWTGIINKWFSQHVNYKYGPVSGSVPVFKTTNQYTQVIWAKTKYVGCGASSVKKGFVFRTYVVCNYGPGGNVEGEKPYETGSGCENLCCDERCNKLYGKSC